MDKETLKLAAATIREEMVCCDMRDQVSRAYREGGVVAVRALKRTSDYHAICNYGEMAASYVEELLGEEDLAQLPVMAKCDMGCRWGSHVAWCPNLVALIGKRHEPQ